MGKYDNAEQKEFLIKYQELLNTIDEMDGEDKEQVEESKATLIALVKEALDIDFAK